MIGKIKVIQIISIALVLLATAPLFHKGYSIQAQQDQYCEIDIEGSVTYESTGNPVSGQKVVLWIKTCFNTGNIVKYTTYTNSAGYFNFHIFWNWYDEHGELRGLHNIKVKVERSGYKTVSRFVSPPFCRYQLVDIILKKISSPPPPPPGPCPPGTFECEPGICIGPGEHCP